MIIGYQMWLIVVTEHKFDVICLGRAVVDLYGEQLGERLENMSTFAKYVGGSSANMAIGMSRQGCRVAMLTRVGNEHMGQFVRSELETNGVDVSHVITDSERLTGLVFLGIQDRETFPLVFYRENCADMALSENDFNEDFIASSKNLCITGTHLSTPEMKKMCLKALEYARRNGTKTALDIDYRPVLWGLTPPRDGEVRFVANAQVTKHLQSIVPLFNLIVGTEEEIHIAGGSVDTLTALKSLRGLTDAVLVVKCGPQGCVVFPGEIPDSMDQGISVPSVKVEVLNVLGAGDAFMSGLMRGWVNQEPWEQTCRYANACGALVVTRHGCAPEIPTKKELDYYLEHVDEMEMDELTAKVSHLHRVTTRHNGSSEICALAFDHRLQLEHLAEETGANLAQLSKLKMLIARASKLVNERLNLEGRAGILVDRRYGKDVLNQETGNGLWIACPVELPGSRPLSFEEGNNIGLALRTWPKEHVVKCLVFYHPDDTQTLRKAQEDSICQLYRACVDTDHELLLEIILPSEMPQNELTLARALESIYQCNVYPDWWKLSQQKPESWGHVERVIKSYDPHCRGVLLLGLDAAEEDLLQGFRDAAGQSICKGFAVGRTIFSEHSRQWLSGEIDDETAVEAIAGKYQRVLEMWDTCKVQH